MRFKERISGGRADFAMRSFQIPGLPKSPDRKASGLGLVDASKGSIPGALKLGGIILAIKFLVGRKQ
jgi:hypothetical protein